MYICISVERDRRGVERGTRGVKRRRRVMEGVESGRRRGANEVESGRS